MKRKKKGKPKQSPMIMSLGFEEAKAIRIHKAGFQSYTEKALQKTAGSSH